MGYEAKIIATYYHVSSPKKKIYGTNYETRFHKLKLLRGDILIPHEEVYTIMGLRTLCTLSDKTNEAEIKSSVVNPSVFTVKDCFFSGDLNENVLGSTVIFSPDGIVVIY